MDNKIIESLIQLIQDLRNSPKNNKRREKFFSSYDYYETEEQKKRAAQEWMQITNISWFKEFSKKRINIAIKYKLDTPEKIADFFTFSNMKKKERNFCPLYKYKNPGCHPKIPGEDLVCFFCACPFFDNSHWKYEEKEFGICKLPNSRGKRNIYGYWDCSSCNLPHRKSFVINFLKNTKEGQKIMKKIKIGIKNEKNND